MKTFALSRPTTPTVVSLWCEPLESMHNNARRFFVINGAWEGRFLVTTGNVGVVIIAEADEPMSAILVWEGEVPDDYNAKGQFRSDYNGAIAWIENEIKAGRGWKP